MRGVENMPVSQNGAGKTALVVGGGNGIGLSIAIRLSKFFERVIVADRNFAKELQCLKNVEFLSVNLVNECDCEKLMRSDVDALVWTAGFGRCATFDKLTDAEIVNSIRVNEMAFIRVVKFYSGKLYSAGDFYCAAMASIAGIVASPLFSVYSATKAALCKFGEAVNCELDAGGFKNRILVVSPGSIKGTKFNGGDNDLSKTESLAREIVSRMFLREAVWIPCYEETYKGVIERYQNDAMEFARQSYEYKMASGRMSEKPQVKVGYLSGTFDLFHIGHLNLIRRAKEMCDCLVVGVHKDASHKGKVAAVSFEERCEIVKACRYVDKVVEAKLEDCDAWNDLRYDLLFVGSDYKGSERFNNYEKYFSDKDVKIVYFPYTQGTSSTKIREFLDEKTQNIEGKK